jgi:hypothetical protein
MISPPAFFSATMQVGPGPSGDIEKGPGRFPRLMDEAAEQLETALFGPGGQTVDTDRRVIGDVERNRLINMAGPEGIEPPTRGLGDPSNEIG